MDPFFLLGMLDAEDEEDEERVRDEAKRWQEAQPAYHPFNEPSIWEMMWARSKAPGQPKVDQKPSWLKGLWRIIWTTPETPSQPQPHLPDNGRGAEMHPGPLYSPDGPRLSHQRRPLTFDDINAQLEEAEGGYWDEPFWDKP